MAVTSDKADADAAAAANALLEEVKKERDRSIETIESLVRKLEESELPKKGKLKRAVTTTWRLDYASDDAAIAPFLTGPAGPLAVLEGVVHTMKPSGDFSSVEVKRPFGPFGNSKAELCGKWSLSG